MLTRRHVIRTAVQAAAAAAVLPARTAEGRLPPRSTPSGRRCYCLFSKPLPHLAWGELGRAVKDAGFDAVDLTVRAKGHVLPERAAEDLPRAIDAIATHGVTVPMITTDLTSADTPFAKPLLQAAARSGVGFFKTGYWRYTSADVRADAAAAGRSLEALASLARDCGIALGFHNHAGYVGAALWDIAPAMDGLDARWAGYYFDPRHAVAEGAGGAWKTATRLVLPRLKMIALKDFVWRKNANGWRLDNCPLGEGVVDWSWFGEVVPETFRGPISIHLEYELPGATLEERTRSTLDAARRDLSYARRILG